MAVILIIVLAAAAPAGAWFEETHLAIAKAAGYRKWYNAAAADIARVKLGAVEKSNHYHNSPSGTVITVTMVLEQAAAYDQPDKDGHLYGAIIASLRAYKTSVTQDKYAENHMAYLVHYVGDLSMPLHHTLFNSFNRRHHKANDGIIDNQVLDQVDQIPLYSITLASEADLAGEVARIANLSKTLGHRLEKEDRSMTREEAFRQIGHSASLLKAILAWVEAGKRRGLL